MERAGKRFKKKQRMKNPAMEPTKLDMEIAKYLRFKVPRKSTMMQKQAVEYFVGSKAVDMLMESKWAIRKKGNDQIFVVRDDATRYLDELLQKKFFYRVMKTEKEIKKKVDKEEEKDSEQNQNEKEESKSIEEPETKLRKRKNKKTAEAEDEGKDESKTNMKKGKTKNNKKAKEKKPKEKIKKRYKLTQHEEQKFYDSKDVYIWLYNPIGWKTIAMGMGVLLCVVAATLFPLWPPEVRTGVYYLSIAGGVFIGIIFGVALARTVLYGVIWLFTGGNHQLWILPNILADVGFFESFHPRYTYEYKGSKDEKEDDDDDEQESDEDTKEEKSEDEGEDALEGDASTQQKEHSQSDNSQDGDASTQQKEHSQSDNSQDASESESTLQ